jgi:hypothetical protein
MASPLLRDIRLQHREEHAALDAAVRCALSAAQDADPCALGVAWTDLERRLFSHLEFEETQLFPLLVGSYPGEVQQLLDDHQRLRHLVGELGIGCDLHTLNQRGVEQLMQALDEHAGREDANLYRWLDEAVPVDTRRHLMDLFVKMVRAGLHAGEAKSPPRHAA